MDYPQQHIKPYNEDGKKTEQVERMFDNIAHAYDKLNHTLSPFQCIFIAFKS